MALVLKNERGFAPGVMAEPREGPRRPRSARFATNLIGWAVLVKLGLLTGVGLAASVQHLLAG